MNQIRDNRRHGDEYLVEDSHDVVSRHFRHVVEGLAGVVPDAAVAVTHACQDRPDQIFRVSASLLLKITNILVKYSFLFTQTFI